MQHDECIFCKVASGAFGTPFAFESDNVVAFDDIHPKAPTHILVIPRRHLGSIHEFRDEDADLLTEMLRAVRTVAQTRGIAESGYRLVSNAGPDSGQEVNHVHFHVLGGGPLGDIC